MKVPFSPPDITEEEQDQKQKDLKMKLRRIVILQKQRVLIQRQHAWN